MLVRAELPGVEKIDVTCTEDTVSTTVEKKQDVTVQDEFWLGRESSFGKAVGIVMLIATLRPME